MTRHSMRQALATRIADGFPARSSGRCEALPSHLQAETQGGPYRAADRLMCQLGHLSRLMVKEPSNPRMGLSRPLRVASHIAARTFWPTR